MAIKNDFTKAPNKLFEALARTPLTSWEFRVVMYVVRQTLGWHKDAFSTTVSGIAEKIGMRRNHVQRAINRLVERGIIEKTVIPNVGISIKIFAPWIWSKDPNQGELF